MIVVVDTNILFSAILTPNGVISDLLLNSPETFDFYSPISILEELKNHKQKLLNLPGYTDRELTLLKRILIKRIELIDLETIRKSTWGTAIELTKSIDEFDAPFVALCLELNAALWTGDKKLAKGLSGINWIFNTKKIKEIRDKKSLLSDKNWSYTNS